MTYNVTLDFSSIMMTKNKSLDKENVAEMPKGDAQVKGNADHNSV